MVETYRRTNENIEVERDTNVSETEEYFINSEIPPEKFQMLLLFLSDLECA